MGHRVAIDPARLATVVRAIAGADATLVDWNAEPIEYAVYLPGRSLERVSGRASRSGELVAWSAVRKRRDAPDGREAAVYRSARFDDPARLGLRAARAYAIIEEADAIELWLEALADRHEHRWPLDAFAEAARALGRFNGAGLVGDGVALPAWLSRDWIAKHQQPSILAQVRPTLDARVLPLVDDQPRLASLLDTLPQAICHHDASQANLFLTDAGEVVAIDWEGAGVGAIGADLATLVCGTMRRGAFAVERAAELDRVAFDAYTAGLGDAGFGDRAAARLGYAAAVALRWSIVAAAPESPLAAFVLARAEEATTALR